MDITIVVTDAVDMDVVYAFLALAGVMTITAIGFGGYAVERWWRFEIVTALAAALTAVIAFTNVWIILLYTDLALREAIWNELARITEYIK